MMCFQSSSHSEYHVGCLYQDAKPSSRYQGFQTTRVVQSSTPNASDVKVKMAQVAFDTPDLASVAKEALDGFTLKKGWIMGVAYI